MGICVGYRVNLLARCSDEGQEAERSFIGVSRGDVTIAAWRLEVDCARHVIPSQGLFPCLLSCWSMQCPKRLLISKL